MIDLTQGLTPTVFFTGKGGVGKTSIACATAIALRDAGHRVLLVSTDPASNLDEALGQKLGGEPAEISALPGLYAMNIDPEEAARAYRERIVGPYRALLPKAAVTSMEEQLSGACTVEIAAFDELARLLGGSGASFDHVLFDTAPTGHTLRLLALPSAWTTFIDENVGGTSCLGPLSGLSAQRDLYAEASRALRDPARTTIVLVTRPDAPAVREAERTRVELAALDVTNLRLVVNGVFEATRADDPVAVHLTLRGKRAIEALPAGLASLPRVLVPLRPFGLVGVEALRAMTRDGAPAAHAPTAASTSPYESLRDLVDTLAQRGHGVIMTMGKGGVGKTTIAARIAAALSARGLPVTLSTTDPAAHVAEAARDLGVAPGTFEITRIDPELETRRYAEDVMRTAGAGLDARGKALLEEDLRSPCTQEIAVFRAFADTVARGEGRFVVLDTAPTGHTLLLLDAAEAYHREVAKKPSGSPEAVKQLLPRLRDPEATFVLLVTLPEATPIHEAKHLGEDLARAGIRPFAWVVNESLTPLDVKDPILVARRTNEALHLDEVRATGARVYLEPWRHDLSHEPGPHHVAPSPAPLASPA
ncbi:MAG: arsenical pump-driving ATPase [Myxococcales bacterium]|nr:arsenical pump-driving ATPase [Myxococcales bacterium]